jgi:ABC-type multidrug transport system fused ATPase/permease subunit
MLDLKPSIAETSENAEKGPAEGCSSYEFDEVNFAYPLAPNNRVLKDISVKVSTKLRRSKTIIYTYCLTCRRLMPANSLHLLVLQVVARAQ